MLGPFDVLPSFKVPDFPCSQRDDGGHWQGAVTCPGDEMGGFDACGSLRFVSYDSYE